MHRSRCNGRDMSRISGNGKSSYGCSGSSSVIYDFHNC